MNVAIADDLASDLRLLEDMVRAWFRVSGKSGANVQTFASGEALLRA